MPLSILDGAITSLAWPRIYSPYTPSDVLWARFDEAIVTEWRRLKRTFDGGLHAKPVLRQAYLTALEAHVAAGHGALPESAIFVRISVPADTYEFYFTPQALLLIGPFVTSLGADACEIPARRSRTGDRYGALALLVGEAGAWELLNAGDAARAHVDLGPRTSRDTALGR